MSRAYAGQITPSLNRPVARIVDRSRLARVVPRSQPIRPAVHYDNDILQPQIKNPTSLYNVAEASVPTEPMPVVKPQSFAKLPDPGQEASRVLKRQFVEQPEVRMERPAHRYSRLQVILVGMAFSIFVLGLLVTVQTFQANHDAKAQVAALARKAGDKNSNASAAIPSTNTSDSNALAHYTVAPDLPRYIKITKLGITARVLQTGITNTGALGTPNNVYDTAWYTGSAKPGQPGATLIDGHVSSWTTHGVFYNIKNLISGDTIQIVRGDGAVLNYRVMKTQVYSADNVDMHAALSPVSPAKAGLNLITCTGKVKPGTSEFNQRVIVFSQQI
ncbi:MAG: sortase [Candidatus Saccharimonadales bacterium]